MLIFDPVFAVLFAGWIWAANWRSKQKWVFIFVAVFIAVELLENLFLFFQMSLLVDPTIAKVELDPETGARLALSSYFTMVKFPLYVWALIWWKIAKDQAPFRPFTIAIDGPAAAGKGTISKAVAAHFGFAHLDTGLLYRAVGRATLDGTPAIEAAQALKAEDLEKGDLRSPEVAQAASKVAVITEVRAALVDFQRSFARRSGGAVLDGRDIGTVICPDAEAKLFVTASAEVRAERRWKELVEKGHSTSLDEVLADVRARDARDMNRAEAPLKPAADAVIIDTSTLSIEEAVAAAIAAIEDKRTHHA